MTDKKVTRLRRARKARLKMHELEVVRLCVFRSSQHIYAQVISARLNTLVASPPLLPVVLAHRRRRYSNHPAPPR
ncbi:50S ribosomal protein L18, partial [Pseudomonas sp. NPDC089918]|uniref:50S ribosomal protein L18 n=1 Tax=Pseudomonas sp. NPDC089918 TaxID=3390654 RepID=UPI003CFEC1F7